jgi:toxin-antitoxin system PIN domain toxin
MIHLLDVNVLIALCDPAHPHAGAALQFFRGITRDGWATCPLSENGCIRILSQPSYSGGLALAEASRRLKNATLQKDHVFWPDSLSFHDDERVNVTCVLSPRWITDVYLLALAVEHGGRLVTFDQGIPLAAVRRATSKNLLVL